MAITRKAIEDYYQSNFFGRSFISVGAISLLSELTCRAYRLNQPQVPDFIKEKEPPKPQNLGHI